MRTIDADALQRELEKSPYNDYDDFLRTERLIDDAPTVEPVQKVVVVQPEIIKSVAEVIVDTIYKLDWDKIIKMYRGDV